MQTPAPHILELGVDLVVMTTHSWRELSRAWVGRMTDQLIRSSEVPSWWCGPAAKGVAERNDLADPRPYHSASAPGGVALAGTLYLLLSVNGVSRVIGVTELIIAGLILCRPWSARLSAVGSMAAIGMFLLTLSFLVTTPGLWQWVDGFPAPDGAAAFLLKDAFLLGAAMVTAGEASRSERRAVTNRPPRRYLPRS